MTIPPFVKKFDFRGIYNQDIKNADGYYLAKAIAKVLPMKKVIVGWDTRDSSKHLAFHFMHGMIESNIRISYMDKCPIDYVTAAANAFDFDLSVMVTGSHNPWNWTGLLIHTKGGDSIQGELVQKIIEQYNEESIIPYNDKTEAINLDDHNNFFAVLEEEYAKKIKSLIPLDKIKPCKVLVDVGDGSGSRALSLLDTLLPQVTFDRIHDRLAYNASSSHVADPSQINTMTELMNKVQHGYDGGFAFDSDADRVLAVDEKGGYLNGSLLGSAMTESFLALKLPDKKIGYSVDCGPSLPNALAEFGSAVHTVPLPVGRSIMRTMLREGDLDFGVENVGHFYTKDFFMTDSGTFSLAVILYWMSVNGPLSSLNEKYPDGNRQHLFEPVDPESDKNHEYLYEQINKHYKGNYTEKKIEVDGLRYEFYEGKKLISWYAMRKSGYEQVEKYYFGSLEEKEFNYLKGTFEELFEEKRKK